MLTIRRVSTDDATAIATIYNYYIEQTVITFEEVPVTADDICQRIATVASLGLPWIVGMVDGQIVGYAYAGTWRVRSAYRFAVESAIYLDRDYFGRGYGTAIYGELFELLRQTPVHAVLGSIALPNEASIALHEKLGMVKVAHFPQVGWKFNQWIDVGFWQITFD